ncbi:MAG: hypothetical protein NWE95_02190 [Candidatus Bathyarchaeota archaeon]|nr:hypothetical protein [Candidatus Bathyarchaeota archaeon]
MLSKRFAYLIVAFNIVMALLLSLSSQYVLTVVKAILVANA